MNESEKRQAILRGCERWKGHWMRVYLADGSDFRVKAEKLKEMVEKNQLNLNLVKRVYVDDDYLKVKPEERKTFTIPKKYIPIGSGGANSNAPNKGEGLEVLLGVLVVLIVVGFILGR